MVAATRPKVFLSSGRTETPQQDAFVNAVIQCLQDEGFEVVRALWSSEQPLKPIWRKLKECAGTTVIAFERLHFEAGVEFRRSTKERPLRDTSVPTVWNQIEAAMAYTLNHPLFVVVEEGLREEGLLEGRYDWYVQRVRLDPAVLSEREFRGVLNDWKDRVAERQAELTRGISVPGTISSPPNPDALTVAQLLGALKPAQLWGVVAAIATALATVFTAAFALGSLTSQR
jgi:hypothetical protein